MATPVRTCACSAVTVTIGSPGVTAMTSWTAATAATTTGYTLGTLEVIVDL